MRRSRLLLVLTMLSICSTSLLMAAQDTVAPQPPARQSVAFRLDLSINELVEGKKVNSRHYSMNVASQTGNGGFQQLKIGTRVPVQSEEGKEGKFEYLDLGTSITVHMSPAFPTSPATIDVNAEIASIADPDQAKLPRPLLRQVRLSGSLPLIPDKQMVIASADDPDSNHEFQLTILATKLTP